MKIETSFEIAFPIEALYREINDVGRIGYCVAGVKDVRVLTADESLWKVEARAGFMARTFNLRGKIVERRPPEYIAFVGQGQDVEVTGHLNLKALGPSLTKCEAVVEATVTGAFASVVDLMARGPQQALIQQTIDNLRNRLASLGAADEVAVVATAPPESSSRIPAIAAPSGIWGRLRRRLASKSQLALQNEHLASRLRALEDERGIVATINQYAQAIDYGAHDQWLNCFTLDGVLDIRPQFNGEDRAPFPPRRYSGRAELEGFIKALIHSPEKWQKHLVGQSLVELLSHSTASATSYIVRVDETEGTLHVFSIGRYKDRFVRGDDGRWRIAERIVEVEGRNASPPMVRQLAGPAG
jgi:carbon monoxide dehydrogenase subunit G